MHKGFEMKLKPGVVFGDSYTALVENCKEKGYALPAVNVVGTNSINAVLAAARDNHSDIIVQLSNGGASFYAGKELTGENGRLLGAVSAAQHVHLLAEHYGVCVVLHTDHANRSLLPWIDNLISYGESYYKEHKRPLFTSHMIDLSEETLEENVAICKDALKRMAPLGMSLEIELGVTGGEEDGVGSDDIDNARLYTQPEEVLYAYKELSPHGHFSVAASFGNVHGVYKPGKVQLRPSILKHSQDLVAQEMSLNEKKPLNLVFHGGSGSEKEKIQEAISYGVFKMNIDTDTQFAFAKAVGSYVEDHKKAFLHQIDPDTGKPYKKEYDPRMFLYEGEKSMKERLTEAFKDLNAVGHSMAMR